MCVKRGDRQVERGKEGEGAFDVRQTLANAEVSPQQEERAKDRMSKATAGRDGELKE